MKVQGRRREGFKAGLRLAVAFAIGAALASSASSARASAALVQNNTATGTSPVVATWALAGGVTAGHLLVATVSAQTGSTITAPAGWTLIGSSDFATKIMVAMYYIEGCSSKPQNTNESFTAMVGGTASNGTTVRLMEFSGVIATGALDASGTATGGGNSLSVSTTGIVNTSPELGVAILSHQINDSGANLAANAPYTEVSADITTARNVEDTVYNTGVTSGAVSTASLTATGTGHSWAAVIATFQEAPLYWRGGLMSCPSGSLFTNTSCWSTSSGGGVAGVAPGSADRAIFDAAATGNCALSSTVATQAGSITTTSGYTGTISQGTQDVSLSNDLALAGGRFTGRAGQTIATNLSGPYNGGIVVSGGIFDGNGATLAVKSLFVSSGTFTAGAGPFSTNNAGISTVSGGTATFSSGGVTFAGLVTTSGGSLTFGSGALSFGDGLDVEGGTVTFGSSSSTVSVTGTAEVTVGAGTVNFTNGAASPDFSTALVFTQSGGIVNVNGASVAFGTTITGGDNQAFLMTGGTFNNTSANGVVAVGSASVGGGAFDQTGSGAIYNGVATATEIFYGRLKVSGAVTLGAATMSGMGVATRKDVFVNLGGTLSLSSAGFTFPNALTLTGTLNAGTGTTTFTPAITVTGTLNGSTGIQAFTNTLAVGGTYDGSTATQQFANAVTISGTLKTGTASMTGGSAATRLVTVSSGGTMTLASSGFAFNSTTAMPVAGTLNLAGTVSFAGALTLTGTLNMGATTTTISTAVTMTGTSAFNGGTGTTTFSLAPTLTAGTFTVGTAGSTGSVVMSSGATFGSGMTLAFPTSGSALTTPGGQTISIGGTVTSTAGAAATPPKISRSSGATGITVAITGGTLNADGLEFDNVISTGVSIASGVTYTKLAHLTFKNNLGGAGSRHLVITLASAVINVPGCFFDTTAVGNVKLVGATSAARAHAVFEFQSTSVNGLGAGEGLDDDADNLDTSPTNNDATDTTTSPYFGSVVEWAYASPADTSGVPTGSPIPVFNWNTFAYLGVYATFNNISSGTTDELTMRKADGTASYVYDMPAGVGDIVGNPRFDSIASEATANVDVNGDGDKLDTNFQVVYIGTASGHIIKLIDTGSAFVRPGTSSPWNTDFNDAAAVSTITSPLISDGTNLYFGGTLSGTTKIFGVQISGGVFEKTVQKSIATVGTGALASAPAWGTYGAATYLFIGSKAVSSQAYVYAVEVSPSGTHSSSYLGATTDVNGGINLISGRGYASTTGGVLHALNASAPATSLPALWTYTTSPISAIPAAAYIDPYTNYAYFGDSSGRVFVIKDTGVIFSASYPFQVAGGSATMTTPLYRKSSGTIAVGASDGYVYFINRRDATSTPQIRKRYFVGNSAVTAVSYNATTSQYMVASNDGRMSYIPVADVGTDTDGVE